MYNKTVVHANQFIILSMEKGGSHIFSMSKNPKIHSTYQEALHEAQRLASIEQSKKFVVVAVAAVAETRPVEAPVVTSYGI